jgi:hypothetical protein
MVILQGKLPVTVAVLKKKQLETFTRQHPLQLALLSIRVGRLHV